MITLRPYQQQCIERLRVSLRSHRRTLLVSPTGSGKTVMFSYMAQAASSKGLRVCILVHREELIAQVSETLARFGVRHGFVAAGRPLDLGAGVWVASVFTLIHRLARFPAPDLVIVDEAHHATAASSWGKVLAAWPNARQIGVTATPQRLDGTGLAECFDDLVMGPTVAELMELGNLCGYKLFAPSQPDLDGVHKRAGDFAKGELATAMDKPSITGDAVSHYRRLCPGRRAVVFCVSLEHADHVARQFAGAGFPSQRIDGSMDRADRRLLVQSFSRGSIKVLTSCDLISEGFDLPAIEAAVLLRPTQSLSLYLQQVGRALRPFDGKPHAVILDHAGNALRHGLPDDDRDWSLAGREKKTKGEQAEVSVVLCEGCFAALPAGTRVCPECGKGRDPKPREIAERDGELQEVDVAAARAAQQAERKQEQRQASTFDELVALGRARGYRRAELWAKHIMMARGGRRAVHA